MRKPSAPKKEGTPSNKQQITQRLFTMDLQPEAANSPGLRTSTVHACNTSQYSSHFKSKAPIYNQIHQ